MLTGTKKTNYKQTGEYISPVTEKKKQDVKCRVSRQFQDKQNKFF